MKVWIDGQVVDADQARVPVMDHGLLYGDGIFEGIRIYGGGVFRLPDHLRRFQESARAVGLRLPYEPDRIREIVLESARAFGEDEAYIRLVVTRGDGGLGVDPTLCDDPRLFCIVAHINLFSPSKLRTGVSMVTVSVRRPAPDALDPRVKSLNYMNNAMAKREARLRGADEALVLNAQGRVAEASVANVFTVRGGALTTPPTTDGALDGITRDSVLRMADELGLANREASLSRIDLLRADEVFLSGTGAGIVPVASLDGERIGFDATEPGEREVTTRIRAAFFDFTRRHATPLGLAAGAPASTAFSPRPTRAARPRSSP